MERPRIYDYECQRCGEWVDLRVEYDQRDDKRTHGSVDKGLQCRGQLKRGWMPGGKSPTKVSEGYQMQGIVYDGEKKVGPVAGNFGRAPPKRRRRF